MRRLYVREPWTSMLLINVRDIPGGFLLTNLRTRHKAECPRALWVPVSALQDPTQHGTGTHGLSPGSWPTGPHRRLGFPGISENLSVTQPAPRWTQAPCDTIHLICPRYNPKHIPKTVRPREPAGAAWAQPDPHTGTRALQSVHFLCGKMHRHKIHPSWHLGQPQ